jgi:hypothetical protein
VPSRDPDRWALRLLIPALIWGQVILVGGTLLEPTPGNLTLLFSIEAAGTYTLLLALTRRWWLPRLSRRPVLSAVALGVLNAAVIEAEFWAFERVFGASGVAASPDLVVDWIITMPWYAGMVFLFVRGQNRSRFGAVTILFLGGLYETAADGVVGGQVVPALLGEPVAFGEAWAFLALVAFWQFILVYSSMLLPPAWVLGRGQASPAAAAGRRAWDALAPLLWAVPYTVYLVVVLVMMALVSGG